MSRRRQRQAGLTSFGLAVAWAVAAGVPGAGAPLRTGAQVAQEARSSARERIEQCARRAGIDVAGIDALSARCPGIEQDLHDLGFDALLPRDARATLDAAALEDLLALSSRYERPAPRPQPSVARLRAIASSLQPAPAPSSWWARMKAWLGRQLRPVLGDSIDWRSLLPRWIAEARVGPRLIDALIVVVLIAAGVGAIVKLRAAGVIGAGRRRARRADRSAPPVRRSPEPTIRLEDIDAAPLRDQPVLLLRLVVEALTRSNRLERERDLTCRELVAHARLDTAIQRERFLALALLAERALYGPRGSSPEPAQETLSHAGALYSQLVASPASGVLPREAAEP